MQYFALISAGLLGLAAASHLSPRDNTNSILNELNALDTDVKAATSTATNFNTTALGDVALANSLNNFAAELEKAGTLFQSIPFGSINGTAAISIVNQFAALDQDLQTLDSTLVSIEPKVKATHCNIFRVIDALVRISEDTDNTFNSLADTLDPTDRASIQTLTRSLLNNFDSIILSKYESDAPKGCPIITA